jgi:hypothetical protein
MLRIFRWRAFAAVLLIACALLAAFFCGARAFSQRGLDYALPYHHHHSFIRTLLRGTQHCRYCHVAMAMTGVYRAMELYSAELGVVPSNLDELTSYPKVRQEYPSLKLKLQNAAEVAGYELVILKGEPYVLVMALSSNDDRLFFLFVDENTARPAFSAESATREKPDH